MKTKINITFQVTVEADPGESIEDIADNLGVEAVNEHLGMTVTNYSILKSIEC